MMFLYIRMVRSSYIIILSGMGDDVPIWGAVVTLFDGKGLLLLPPKLQRRGLVFKGKMVTMERV